MRDILSSVGDYLLAFDDSGGIEQLCKWDGTPIRGDHPITVLAAFYISAGAAESFESRWAELRTEIGKQLGCPPPPIHLRLMWGKSVKRKYRGRENPYVDASFEAIQGWLGDAWAIIDELVRRREAGWFWMEGKRDLLAGQQSAFVKDERYRQELDFIKARSRKMYRGYHRLITSPLLGLYTDALRHADEMMRAVGRATTVDILVDSFADSHGIDALATVEAMKRHGRLQRIGTVSRVGNADESALVQAADLIGYSMFRHQMIKYGHIARDEAFLRIAQGKSGQTITRASIPHKVRLRYRGQPQTALTMHYALARAHVEHADPAFAADYLIPVEEFDERALASIRNGDVGVSVLTQAAIEEIARAAKMPKTPD